MFANLESLFEHGHHVHEYRFRHRDGRYIWMRDELNVVRDADGTVVELVGYWVDVTKRKQAEEALCQAYEDMARLATTDDLTGLYNRRELMNRLAREMKRSRRHQLSMAMLSSGLGPLQVD